MIFTGCNIKNRISGKPALIGRLLDVIGYKVKLEKLLYYEGAKHNFHLKIMNQKLFPPTNFASERKILF
jgi:hypothetical protein